MAKIIISFPTSAWDVPPTTVTVFLSIMRRCSNVDNIIKPDDVVKYTLIPDSNE